MRTLLLFSVSALLMAADAEADEATQTKVMADIKACMASENLGSLGQLRANSEARTAEEKCFVGCMMKNLHVLNSDGQYDLALLKERANDCPELARDPRKKADTLLVAEACAPQVTGCSGYCECGVIAGNCLARGMEAKGHETIYDFLRKTVDKMDV
uniref:Odorant-binding protein 6 n=1 Tax=Oedaleus infernalis TaxID=267432 RepID=A0A385I8B9_9ORTH|nr:odorant-binding protein 6 [Oedaleus infernalis]